MPDRHCPKGAAAADGRSEENDYQRTLRMTRVLGRRSAAGRLRRGARSPHGPWHPQRAHQGAAEAGALGNDN